ncbi:chondroitinase-B domain-containing protein [Paenibacillus sp. UNC451MF]|uniref:chondroitinase-B domain-containing protein n=1 Tax=Paenibacillus sp. UNC451MF TaxID=1449063 RepID=UPI00048BBF9F|nr:chondroitinase-B domain-containing protein [Paenibacillus sp. UNC451MF]
MSRQLIINTKESLYSAIKEALPGDTLILNNGVWTDLQLDLDISGTLTDPITLKAETPGEVVLTGASTLTFFGEHLVVDGLFFKEGIQPGINGSITIIRFLPDSKHCRLTNSAIIDCHPVTADIKTFWVTIDGSHHEVDHCYFKGKLYAGQLMRSMKYSNHNRIHTNYFVDIPAYGINGLEIIQVMGIGSDGEPGSAGGEHVIIENNLFERADGECEEVISIKSNHDVIRNNTFKDSIGGLVIRSGHNTVVEGNFFLGGSVGGTKGIRVTGEDNVVRGNYLSNLQGFALSVMSGEYIDEPLTDEWKPVLRQGTPLGRVPVYNWSKHNVITHNQLIYNHGLDLDMGIGYKSAWPSKQRILLPERNVITDNVIVKDRGESLTFAQQDPSVMNIEFASNRYADNKVSLHNNEEILPEGFVHSELSLETLKDGDFKYCAEAVPLSFQGLLNEFDVGPQWVIHKRNEGIPLFQARDQFATLETVPWDAEKHLWILRAGSSDIFVGNWRMKLDVNQREVCPFERDGVYYVPIRSLAERLGLASTQTKENEIQIRDDNRILTLRAGSCMVMQEGIESIVPFIPIERQNNLYLRADEAAELFRKSLYQNEQGVIALSDYKEDTASFNNEHVLHQIAQLFKVAASRFEKNMTMPPQGHSHGKIPGNTLNEDSSLQWISYGDGEWIRYDLGQIQEVGGAVVLLPMGNEVKYSFSIESSMDGVDWIELLTGVSDGEQEKLQFSRTSARYVRIIGHNNSHNNAIRLNHVQWYNGLGEPIS